MKKKWSRILVRASLAIRQNRAAVVFVGAWLAGNFAVFDRAFHLAPWDALLVTTCIAKGAGGWVSAYQNFTEVVVFGVVASLVVANVTRHYRPAIRRARVVVIADDDLEAAAVACRHVREVNARCELVVRCPHQDVGAVLAKTYRARPISTSGLAAELIVETARKTRARSVVVFGKNELGARVVAALSDKRVPNGHAEVTEDPAALAAANVADADLVVLCDVDLGKNLIRVDRIRDLNTSAKIACRAFHDDAAERLRQKPFSCIVLSTSRHAARALVRGGVFRDVGSTESNLDQATPRSLFIDASSAGVNGN